MQVNLALRELCEEAFGRCRTPRDPTVHRTPARCTPPRRSGSATRSATWLSPASCGVYHADPQIEWLAQGPVSRVLEAEAERIHPASPRLASESRHIESESAEHDLHCSYALRRMDEILAASSGGPADRCVGA